MTGEKKYYWLRLKRDFFKRHDIRVIESMPNGKDYILFYLKLLCESVDHEGNLRFSEQVPYNEDMLSVITNTNVDIVRRAIEIFTQLEMMEILDDGTIYMSEVQKMLGSAKQDDHTRESTRERVQAYRERQKLAIEDKKRYSNVTCNGEKEIEKEKELDKELDRGIVKGGNAKRSQTPTPDPFDVEDVELKEALKDFEKMRKGIKAPLTDRAKKQILTKLNKLASDTTGKVEVLNQSIVNCWKDVYELHENDSFKSKKQKVDVLAEWNAWRESGEEEDNDRLRF